MVDNCGGDWCEDGDKSDSDDSSGCCGGLGRGGYCHGGRGRRDKSVGHGDHSIEVIVVVVVVVVKVVVVVVVLVGGGGGEGGLISGGHIHTRGGGGGSRHRSCRSGADRHGKN